MLASRGNTYAKFNDSDSERDGKGNSVNIGRAFTFFLDDPDWIKKVLLAALISLIPFVGSFMLLGWGLAVTRNVYYDTDTPLPEWNDLGTFLVRGLLAGVGALIWALPVVLIWICVGVTIAIWSDSDLAVALIVMGSLGIFLVTLVYLAIVLPIPIARYAVKDDFGAMFEFGPIAEEIRRGIGPLLIALIVWFVASAIIAPLGIVACFVGVYVTTALSYLMIGHAMGQAYREIDRPQPTSRVEAF